MTLNFTEFCNFLAKLFTLGKKLFSEKILTYFLERNEFYATKDMHHTICKILCMKIFYSDYSTSILHWICVLVLRWIKNNNREMNIAESFQIFISFFNSTCFFYLHQTEQLTQDSVIYRPKQIFKRNSPLSFKTLNLWFLRLRFDSECGPYCGLRCIWKSTSFHSASGLVQNRIPTVKLKISGKKAF